MGIDNEENDPAKNSPVGDPVGNKEPDPIVNYSSYQKVLDEKRKLKVKFEETNTRLAEFEAKERELEDKKLIDEQNFAELHKRSNETIEKLTSELSSERKNYTDAVKLNTFLGHLGSAKVEQKYYGLIPLDKIKINDEGSIDEESLSSTVNEFREDHKRLLITPKNDLPANSTGGSGKPGLTVAEWKGLKSSKEMRERANEVDWATGNK